MAKHTTQYVTEEGSLVLFVPHLPHIGMSRVQTGMASSEGKCWSMGFGFRNSQTHGCARCEQRRKKLFIPTSVWIDGRKRVQSSSTSDTVERCLKSKAIKTEVKLWVPQKMQLKPRVSMASIQDYHESLLAQYFSDSEIVDSDVKMTESTSGAQPIMDPRGDSAIFSSCENSSQRPCILYVDLCHV